MKYFIICQLYTFFYEKSLIIKVFSHQFNLIKNRGKNFSTDNQHFNYRNYKYLVLCIAQYLLVYISLQCNNTKRTKEQTK